MVWPSHGGGVIGGQDAFGDAGPPHLLRMPDHTWFPLCAPSFLRVCTGGDICTEASGGGPGQRSADSFDDRPDSEANGAEEGWMRDGDSVDTPPGMPIIGDMSPIVEHLAGT